VQGLEAGLLGQTQEPRVIDALAVGVREALQAALAEALETLLRHLHGGLVIRLAAHLLQELLHVQVVLGQGGPRGHVLLGLA